MVMRNVTAMTAFAWLLHQMETAANPFETLSSMRPTGPTCQSHRGRGRKRLLHRETASGPAPRYARRLTRSHFAGNPFLVGGLEHMPIIGWRCSFASFPDGRAQLGFGGSRYVLASMRATRSPCTSRACSA